MKKPEKFDLQHQKKVKIKSPDLSKLERVQLDPKTIIFKKPKKRKK